MKNLFTFLLISVLSVTTGQILNAQLINSSPSVPQLDTRGSGLPTHMPSTMSERTEEVDGNLFLIEDWNTKGIVYSDGKYFKVDSLNYNMYSEEIGTPKGEDSFFSYDTQFIDSIKIDNISLHKLDGKFYVVLQTGTKPSLYKKYKARTQGSRLVIKDDYYVLSDGKLIKLKPPKNGLEDVFGHQTEVNNELKKETIDSAKADDIKLHKLDGEFYVVLQTGTKASLYKKYETRIQGRRLMIKDDYYVLSGGKLTKLKPSKNALENVFGDQAEAMNKLKKENKLNYKKQDDLILMFESFNNL